MIEQKKLFLLDAMALIYRAHFALSKNPRITSRGLNTGAIMGFTNSVLEIITKEKPTHIGVAFDTNAPTFRHVEFQEYKATRQSQPEEISIAIPYCKKILAGLRIPILELDGYEADDLIGTLAKKAARQGYTVYMMTPDKDFAQLVEEHIFLYKPAYMGNAVDVLGIPEVLEKFEIDRVEQVIDILGLKGDSVDNIPGVPGIGDKTASKLLKDFGSVENIVASVDQLTGSLRKKIEDFGHQGILSKKLATINIDSPIEFDEELLRKKDPDKETLTPVFDELELRTIAKRIFVEEVAGPAKKNTGQLGLFGAPDPETPAIQRDQLGDVSHDYHLVSEVNDRLSLFEKLLAQQEVCFDTETTSLETVEARLVGIAFCWKKQEAYYVPMPESPADIQKTLEDFRPFFENTSIRKIGQNLKYDIQILKNYGIALQGQIFDTMLAHYLIDPETAHGMDILAENYLNYKPISYQELVGTGRRSKLISQIEVEKVKNYACEDADITFQLKEKLEAEIKQLHLEKLLYEVESPLSFVLADMEYTGVKIDEPTLAVMSKDLEKESARTQDEIFQLAGVEFNIGSPKQLGDILFEKMKLIEKPKKTKTGQYATGEEILADLANEHPIASKILEFREYQKLKSTYVDALPRMVSQVDGKVHTDYRQTIAATGRLSSNNPNLQNIPIRTPKGREIRKAFIPSKDCVILSADYSQIELRIMAAFSEDKSMVEAFQKGVDIHSNTASKVFKVPLDQVDSGMRRKAKEVNFGIIYGISAFGLSQNLGISRSEATEIIDSYFKEFPNVKSYMDGIIEKARTQGFVETILGRRRYLPNINSRNFTMRGFAERNAINAPIQGSAADMIKIAMIRIHDWMKDENFKSRMIMQVHDELVFDAYESELENLKNGVEDFMKNALTLSVPMEIGLGAGKNWLEAH